MDKDVWLSALIHPSFNQANGGWIYYIDPLCHNESTTTPNTAAILYLYISYLPHPPPKASILLYLIKHRQQKQISIMAIFCATVSQLSSLIFEEKAYVVLILLRVNPCLWGSVNQTRSVKCQGIREVTTSHLCNNQLYNALVTEALSLLSGVISIRPPSTTSPSRSIILCKCLLS